VGGIVALAAAAPALADVVWPGLYIEIRYLSGIPIAVGLLVEFLALRFGLKLTWERALFVDICMNAVSTIAGILLIPVGTLAGQYVIEMIFPVRTFHPFSWVVTFVVADLITTAIEALVVRFGFRIKLGARGMWILLGANAASILVAVISAIVDPPRT
jgi:hypothetical protein